MATSSTPTTPVVTEDTTLSGAPSSLQKLYLLSLTEKNREIWNDPNQARLQTRRRGVARPAYVWDLHRLADTVGAPSTTGDGYAVMPTTTRYWRPLWATEFSDDAGSDAYQAIHAGHTVSSFTLGKAQNFRYRGDIAFRPMVVDSQEQVDPDTGEATETLYNDSSYGEQVVLEALLYPAMPFVLTTTTPSASHFGPVFASQISLSVSGEQGLGPVEIRMSFDGGRALRAPVRPAALPRTTTRSEVSGYEPDGSATYETITDYWHHRSANLGDCMASTGIFTDVQEMRDALQVEFDAERDEPTNHLVAMSLEMRQEITFETTTARAPRKDVHGPRFAAIHDRVVTGSFSYYSRNEAFSLPTDDAVTLYFGGGFLLPLPAITWQHPRLTLRAGSGFLHQYSFIARAAPGAVAQGFSTASEGMPVSEFFFGTQRLVGPPPPPQSAPLTSSSSSS